jgi:fibro-slime domain-containing protein
MGLPWKLVARACALSAVLTACSDAPRSAPPPRDGGPDAPSDGDVPADDGEVDAMVPDICGDGVHMATSSAEQCDDMNFEAGDGCGPTCLLEPGYQCPPTGGSCASECGDGIVVLGEECDDGNPTGGDGCGQTCQLEDGWACPVADAECVAGECGDTIVVGDEECDDDDDLPGDGCGTTCQVEDGWICSGTTCSAALCGDGIRVGDEVCDDGPTGSGDGCAADCSAREPFYVCPANGGTCTKFTECGDGDVTADEECDDGGEATGDGCDDLCLVEDGYACPAGRDCAPVCGDGLLIEPEQCDDGGRVTPGCDASCRIEPGYHCATPGAACTAAVCGNGLREGLEQCDDGALVMGVAVPDNELGDGCTPTCTREPNCSNGACVATCGDGILTEPEVCDDGNARNNDGCNSTCAVLEPGFECTAIDVDPPTCVDLSLVLRDFKSHNVSGGHPNFNNLIGSETGIVQSTLGVDLNNDGVADANPPAGVAKGPVYAGGAGTTTTTGATRFNEWYRDSNYAKTVVSTLRVCDDDEDGIYEFYDRTFYPMDGEGWQDPALIGAGETLEASLGPDTSADMVSCSPMNSGTDPDAGANHNYGFTSEVRFWFTYKGTEVLTFTGDDDVWVFIDGKRVIDLGGVHCAENATVDLGAQGATLGLVVGKVYEAVVYQAERHVTESSYRLELGNFFARKTECESICGDGIRTADELCDSGSECVGRCERRRRLYGRGRLPGRRLRVAQRRQLRAMRPDVHNPRTVLRRRDGADAGGRLRRRRRHERRKLQRLQRRLHPRSLLRRRQRGSERRRAMRPGRPQRR